MLHVSISFFYYFSRCQFTGTEPAGFIPNNFFLWVDYSQTQRSSIFIHIRCCMSNNLKMYFDIRHINVKNLPKVRLDERVA